MMNAGGMIKRGLAALFPGAILIRGKNRDGRIALTFDDGPHPENTRRILDVLDRHGIAATFFVQGQEAEKYPALVREIHARGHQIGNHGYTHLDARRTPRRAYLEEVHRAQALLQDMLGAPLDRIFRPPFGNVTGATFLPLALAGYRFVFWSLDSRDSFSREPAALLAHLTAQNIGGGDILLFHEDYAHTVESLPPILHALKQRSLEFARISSL